MINTYAAGVVVDGSFLGGLIGDDRGDVTDSYWDTEASGQSTSGGGTGFTTSEMQGSEADNNMSGFDFTDTWEIVQESDEDSTGDGYPILADLDRETQLELQNILNN